MGVLGNFKRNFEIEKARLSGTARSRARMIKQAKDVPGLADRLVPGGGISRPTGDAVRMLDGKPMVFFTDGSLRHLVGKKTTKAARKALKRARRDANKKPA